MNRITLPVLIFLVVCLPLVIYAADVSLTSDGKVPGTPFQALQDQIDQLNQRLDNIVLLPGPEGPQGPPGEACETQVIGVTGPQGPQGPVGQPGLIDPGLLTYRSCNNAYECLCEQNEIAISGTVSCGGNCGGCREGVISEVTTSVDIIYGLPRNWAGACVDRETGEQYAPNSVYVLCLRVGQ